MLLHDIFSKLSCLSVLGWSYCCERAQKILGLTFVFFFFYLVFIIICIFQGPVSILTAGTTESTTPHGCLQIEKRESNQRKSCSLEKKTKWLAVDPCPSYPIHLINNMTTRSSTFLNSQRQSSWFKSNRRTENDENKIGEVETLDLFPLCSEDCSGVNGSKNDTEVAITAINTKLMSPNQYFEFLPLKN